MSQTQVLLVVDMISDYAFPDADQVVGAAERAVPAIRRAREIADAAGVRVVYVNDILDDWRCSRADTLRRALDGERPDLVEPIAPRDDDAFFFKGRHSVFYGTLLAHYLHSTQTERVVFTGQVTEQCILYSAHDAHVREHDVTILRDAVAEIDPDLGEAAMRMMETNIHAEILDVEAWSPAP
jgi:nicotinamidase-related amidase